jgi:circadian clock protein KaiC
VADKARAKAGSLPTIGKSPTGIRGLDEVTQGGLPEGRPTLLCGSAGCGKTLFGMTFLYNGAVEYNEPGAFLAFEEQPEDLIKNVGSLNYDIEKLIAEKKLAIDHVQLDRTQIAESGEYDLEGLFIRLGFAIDSIGAKRVVVDTIETLFSGLENEQVLRSELRRLFEWLKARGVTAIITGERGEGTLTRYGLGGIRRRLRHPARQPHPRSAFDAPPAHRQISRLGPRHQRIPVHHRRAGHHCDADYVERPCPRGVDRAAAERHPDLDQMLEGKGYYKGSSILVSGMAGSGKSTVAAHFADATCAAGYRCIYFAMEESPAQVVRNMRSVGIDLQKWVDKKLLRFNARRPSLFGLETHLATMYRDVNDFEPVAVVVDPMSALLNAGVTDDVHSMVLRLVDFLKSGGVTALFTNLGGVSGENATTEIQISSLMDVWLLLYNRESNGEHNRQLYLLKSRGMAHSNQVCEFILSSDGIKLRDAYVGPEGVLTGSARLAQEAKDQAAALIREKEMERRTRELERKRRETAAQIEILQAQLANEEAEVELLNREGVAREDQLAVDRVAMAVSRMGAARASAAAVKPTNKPKK